MKSLKLHLCAALVALLMISLACSTDEERRLSDAAPALAPATQATERAQRAIDPIADQARQVADVVAQTASDAAGIGVPGAGIIALVASTIGTLLGAYHQRRTGTIPLQTAFEQVVQSVEKALPSKTNEQKAALAAVQDRATRSMVAQVKRS